MTMFLFESHRQEFIKTYEDHYSSDGSEYYSEHHIAEQPKQDEESKQGSDGFRDPREERVEESFFLAAFSMSSGKFASFAT